MAYNMKKKSNRDDLIDSCAYGQQMIDNYLEIIMEQARGVQNFEATAKRGLEVANVRSEEHTSELQSLMRISYAVFCLKKKKKQKELIRTQTKKVENENNWNIQRQKN